jgi:hypothetical protein
LDNSHSAPRGSSPLPAKWCRHDGNAACGNHPNNLLQIRWINTLPANLKTSLNGTSHGFSFDNYAKLQLGGYCFGFNRCFAMEKVTEPIVDAVVYG